MVTGSVHPTVGRNVLGYLPGRDPRLRDEAVATAWLIADAPPAR